MIRVAVIGVGVMGSAIGARLVAMNADVSVFDVDRVKCDALQAKGARVAASARDGTSHADYVITSLNTAEIVEGAVFGPKGIAEAAAPDKLLIDMSSIDMNHAIIMTAKTLHLIA